MNEFIKVSCENMEKEFIEKVLPLEYLSRGILASEGFAFCSLCKSLDIEMILESGVYEGLSTTIWSRFFQDIPIIAIDRKLRENTVQKFDSISNVQLLKGNGIALLPSLIQENSKFRHAIFIDGPKGMEAIDLAKKCLEFENVSLVGLHDLHKISFGKANPRRVFLDKSDLIDFYTDDIEFVKRYAFMDSSENYIGQGDEEIYWDSGWLVSKVTGKIRSLGSYGPTIGFMLRR